MPTALKGAGWRSSRLSAGSKAKQNNTEGLEKEDSPVPDYILGNKPSPRLPAIQIDGRSGVRKDGDCDKSHGESGEKEEESGKIEEENDKIEEEEIKGSIVENENETGNNENKTVEEQGEKGESKDHIVKEESGSNTHIREREGSGSDAHIRVKEESGSNTHVQEKGDAVVRKRIPHPLNELSSGKGAGYCKRVLDKSADETAFPRVPNYGRYSHLVPDSYKMPWRQDMKNRAAIMANVRSAGKEKLPNIEHNDFLFLHHREQISPNVEKMSSVGKKHTMPSIKEILNPAFHHHTIKNKSSQRKAIYPAAPSWHFHHPRLRHVTGCYSCEPDYDE